MEYTSVIVEDKDNKFNIFNNEEIILFNFNDISSYLSNKNLKTISLNNLNIFLNYFQIDKNNFLFKKIIDNQSYTYNLVYNNQIDWYNCNYNQLYAYNLVCNNNQQNTHHFVCNNSDLYKDSYEQKTEIIVNHIDENNNYNYYHVFFKNNYKPALFILKDIEMYLYNQNIKYIEKKDFELYLNRFNLNPDDYVLVKINNNINNNINNELLNDDCSCSSAISYNSSSSNISDITFSIMSYLRNI
tara:strand:- start:121 stop:849 length:729 start_codon:yes stop_codon:yes gene_type:complete